MQEIKLLNMCTSPYITAFLGCWLKNGKELWVRFLYIVYFYIRYFPFLYLWNCFFRDIQLKCSITYRVSSCCCFLSIIVDILIGGNGILRFRLSCWFDVQNGIAFERGWDRSYLLSNCTGFTIPTHFAHDSSVRIHSHKCCAFALLPFLISHLIIVLFSDIKADNMLLNIKGEAKLGNYYWCEQFILWFHWLFFYLFRSADLGVAAQQRNTADMKKTATGTRIFFFLLFLTVTQ